MGRRRNLREVPPSVSNSEVRAARAAGADVAAASLSQRLIWLQRGKSLSEIDVGGTHTDAHNAMQINAALADLAGEVPLVVDDQVSYSASLEIPDGGATIRGYGASGDASAPSELQYTGSDDAIKLAAGFTNGHNKILLREFRLTGSGSAAHGIDLSGPSKYGTTLANLYISGFSAPGSYGLYTANVYDLTVRDCNIIDNHSALYCGSTTVSTMLINCWLKGNIVNYGLHIDCDGLVVMLGGIIDSTSQPSSQIGFYMESGKAHLLDVHFEDLYKPWQIDGATQVTLRPSNIGSITATGTIADSVPCWIERGAVMPISPADWLQAGLGTQWAGQWGSVIAPQVTDPVGGLLGDWSPVIRISHTSASDLYGTNGDAGREGDGILVLIFEDDNTTLVHDSTADYRFALRGAVDWNPSAGDVIAFAKVVDDASSPWYLYEIGRWTGQSDVVNEGGTYTITAADAGKFFHNEGAGSVITYTLPNISGVPQGFEVTVQRATASYALRIDPAGSQRIRGATAGTGAAGKYASLDSQYGVVTLKNVRDDTYWEIISQEGSVSFEA